MYAWFCVDSFLIGFIVRRNVFCCHKAIVRNMSSNQKVSLKSHYGYEIDEVRVMGKDRYVVAHTSDTLILGDLASFKITEVKF